MNTAKPDYRNWSAADFLADFAFQEWVKQNLTGASADSHWLQLMTQFPHLETPMSEARELLTVLYNNPVSVDDAAGKTAVWRGISQHINTGRPARVLIGDFLSGWKKVAVVLLPLLVLAATISYFVLNREGAMVVQHSGEQNELRVITLPDASKVMLGGNSDIRYAEDWDKNEVRELWLKGQARFEVKHLHQGKQPVTDPERFLVHLENGAYIEVLGTVFNVFQRGSISEVVLEEGKVKVVLPGEAADTVYLTPGDLIRINNGKTEYVRSLKGNGADSLDFPAKGNIIQLNNTSVAEIVKLIENNFLKKVEIDNPDILQRKIDGILPMNKESEVLFILSNLLDVKIENTTPGTIRISSGRY